MFFVGLTLVIERMAVAFHIVHPYFVGTARISLREDEHGSANPE